MNCKKSRLIVIICALVDLIIMGIVSFILYRYNTESNHDTCDISNIQSLESNLKLFNKTIYINSNCICFRDN